MLALYVLVVSIAVAHGAEPGEMDVAFLGEHVAFPEVGVSLSFEFGPSDYRYGEPSTAERVSNVGGHGLEAGETGDQKPGAE